MVSLLLEKTILVEEGKIPIIEFIDWYEEFYLALQEKSLEEKDLSCLDILREFYYDFDFYEENEEVRQESSTLYGDHKFFEYLKKMKTLLYNSTLFNAALRNEH